MTNFRVGDRVVFKHLPVDSQKLAGVGNDKLQYFYNKHVFTVLKDSVGVDLGQLSLSIPTGYNNTVFVAQESDLALSRPKIVILEFNNEEI